MLLKINSIVGVPLSKALDPVQVYLILGPDL
jgi:hypothetical protein